MQKNNFDFLRFIFAFTVVIAHIIVLSQNPAIKFLAPYVDSHIAVTGFFIISGFLITKSYISTNNLKQYFVKRANRLLPGYFFTIIITLLLLSFISTFSLSGYFSNPDLYKYLCYNIVFLNFLHPCLPGVFTTNYMCAVNGALWTIKIEVGFYLIMPLIVYFIVKSKKPLMVLVIIYLASLCYKYALAYYFQKTGNNFIDILDRQLPSFMTYFTGGIAMHYYLPKFQSKKNWLIGFALAVFLIEYYFSLEILSPIALTIMVFYVAYGFKFLNDFGKYGDISYGIYIYHFPLIQVCISLGFFQNNIWIVAACIIVTVIILGILSWHLLEKRFVHRRRYQTPHLL